MRLGDYGISRSTLPPGGSKGFGGTEGFMAPEIIRYNGEEEYTEKVGFEVLFRVFVMLNRQKRRKFPCFGGKWLEIAS